MADPHHNTVTNRPECERYLTVNGRLLVDMTKAEYDAKDKIRSCFLMAHSDELHDVLFWLYVTLLFGFSLTYFLGHMLAHKRGWLTVPQGKTWRKNRRK